MYGFLEKRLVSYSLRSKKRRLYIMPTRVGFYFSAVVFILFLISFSFGHSLAYSSSFILISVLLISLPFTNYIISGVEVTGTGARGLYADEAGEIEIQLQNLSGRHRFDLELDLALLSKNQQHRFQSRAGSLAPGESRIVSVSLGDISPGQYQTLNIRLKSSFPFGLFFAWCYYSEAVDVWVFPKRKEQGKLISLSLHPLDELRRDDLKKANKDERILGEHDDFSHHSPFSEGHSFGSVDWKLYARSGVLYVKEFEGDIPQYELIESRALNSELTELASALSFEIDRASHSHNSFMVRSLDFGIQSAVGKGELHAHSILKQIVKELERNHVEKV